MLFICRVLDLKETGIDDESIRQLTIVRHIISPFFSTFVFNLVS